jgi:hypothetical protein
MNCVQGLKTIPLCMKKEIDKSMNMNMRHLLHSMLFTVMLCKLFCGIKSHTTTLCAFQWSACACAVRPGGDSDEDILSSTLQHMI